MEPSSLYYTLSSPYNKLHSTLCMKDISHIYPLNHNIPPNKHIPSHSKTYIHLHIEESSPLHIEFHRKMFHMDNIYICPQYKMNLEYICNEFHSKPHFADKGSMAHISSLFYPIYIL